MSSRSNLQYLSLSLSFVVVKIVNVIVLIKFIVSAILQEMTTPKEKTPLLLNEMFILKLTKLIFSKHLRNKCKNTHFII